MDVLSWEHVKEAVSAKLSHHHMITTVWHPTPGADLIQANCGSARVLVGDPQYQLSTGEIVKL